MFSQQHHMPSSCFYPCPMVPVLCLGDMIYIHQINNDICLLGDPRLLKMFAAQFIIIFGLCITRINSCVIFEMYKGKCEGPIYYQQYGPTETGLNLVNCAQWCLGADICKSIVWEQGVCAEVGLAGTGERVTGNVFTYGFRVICQLGKCKSFSKWWQPMQPTVIWWINLMGLNKVVIIFCYNFSVYNILCWMEYSNGMLVQIAVMLSHNRHNLLVFTSQWVNESRVFKGLQYPSHPVGTGFRGEHKRCGKLRNC